MDNLYFLNSPDELYSIDFNFPGAHDDDDDDSGPGTIDPRKLNLSATEATLSPLPLDTHALTDPPWTPEDGPRPPPPPDFLSAHEQHLFEEFIRTELWGEIPNYNLHQPPTTSDYTPDTPATAISHTFTGTSTCITSPAGTFTSLSASPCTRKRALSDDSLVSEPKRPKYDEGITPSRMQWIQVNPEPAGPSAPPPPFPAALSPAPPPKKTRKKYDRSLCHCLNNATMKKFARHWETACPYNLEKEKFLCTWPGCLEKFTTADNRDRHVPRKHG